VEKNQVNQDVAPAYGACSRVVLVTRGEDLFSEATYGDVVHRNEEGGSSIQNRKFLTHCHKLFFMEWKYVGRVLRERDRVDV